MSIVRQVVEPGRWEIEVAGGATFILTRAQLAARILAQSPPNRVRKAIAQLRLDVRAALGGDFIPERMALRISDDGTFHGVSHFADLADTAPDEVVS